VIRRSPTGAVSVSGRGPGSMTALTVKAAGPSKRGPELEYP
jgi:hypothetical protein